MYTYFIQPKLLFIYSEIINEESDTNSSITSQHQPPSNNSNIRKKLVYKIFSLLKE